MGAVASLVLVGFIALVLAAPDIKKVLGQAGAAPGIGNENVRKVERWTLIFEVGIALTAWAVAGFLHFRNTDYSAVTVDQVVRLVLVLLALVGMPGIYCYLTFRQWQLRRQYRRSDGTLSEEDARRIGSLDKLKYLFLGLMAVSLGILWLTR